MQHNDTTHHTPSPDALLTEILKKYRQIANSNPSQLRNNIPSTDIWRFFVDGNKQANGRDLKSTSPFTEKDSHYHHYTIEEYIKKIEHLDPTKEITKSNLMKILKAADVNITAQELNQLKIIDLINTDRAWLSFERQEPGYLKALAEAFQLIFAYKGPVSLHFIKTLHLVATTDVDNLNKAENEQLNNFRNAPCMNFTLSKNNVTAQGLEEFYLRHQHDDTVTTGNTLSIRYAIKQSNHFCFINLSSLLDQVIQNRGLTPYSEKTLRFYFKYNFTINGSTPSDDIINQLVPLMMKLNKADHNNQLFQTLYNEIIRHENKYFFFSAQSELARYKNNTQISLLLDQFALNDKYNENMDSERRLLLLKAIINLIQQAEQQHPFIDANCRTFCMLLLNYLLIRNGFPLAMLDDPNQFDMYSKDELLLAVLKGMQNTMTLIETGSLHNIKTDDVLNDLKNDINLKKEYDYFNNIAIKEETIRHKNISSTNFFAMANNDTIKQEINDSHKITMNQI